MKSAYSADAVIRFFKEISAIPRASSKEQGIANYLIKFAKQRGLFYSMDDLYNVIIWKNGTYGYSTKEPILIQSHTDMICEKMIESSHDFSTDGIELIFEKDHIRANETTLGADNGIGVAICLAILDNPSISHPPLEAIFTVQEETTMNGVKFLDTSSLKGKRMICLDNMSEEELWIGAASSHEWNCSISKETTFLSEHFTLCRIYFSRFLGGHSGRDIGKNRGNPITFLGKFLEEVNYYSPIYIKQITGGTRLNVIPIRANCEFYIANNQIGNVKKIFGEFKSNLLRMKLENSQNLKIEISFSNTFDNEFECLNHSCSSRIIGSIANFPNGVHLRDSYGNVIISANLGAVRTLEKSITLDFSVRSNREDETKHLFTKIRKLILDYELYENNFLKLDGYEHKSRSSFIDLCKKEYINFFNRKPKMLNVHVSLEAGIFSTKIPGLDYVAIAPTITNAHSPEESCSISSIEHIYHYLLTILKKL